MLKRKPSQIFRATITAVAVLALLVGSAPVLLNAQSLDEIQRQIESLNSRIDESEDRIDELREREDTLKNRLAVLDAEARQLQAEINKTEREIKKTQAEIDELEAQLQRTKELIQENVRVLYKQGNPSTLEILFSSENFTDFINRQEYLDRVKKSLNEAAKESVRLKESLEVKESELAREMVRLEGQKEGLALRQQEQRRLIEETRGEEARYQRLVAEQRQQLEAAHAQQAAIIAAARADSSRNITPGSVGNGGYPDEWAPPVPINSKVDWWGFYNRQCTSYAAWKRYDLGREIPEWGKWGIAHARFWANSGTFRGEYVEGRYAQRSGYTVNNTPAPGAIAVLNAGEFGHVAIVEEVFNGGATFRVSEYNADFNGYYADYNVYTNTASWSFIHD